MAKLAAWMKAKAQIEASDLASSLVPLMLPAVKNIDDYDILPQGKDKKTGSQAGKVTRDSNVVLKESKNNVTKYSAVQNVFNTISEVLHK